MDNPYIITGIGRRKGWLGVDCECRYDTGGRGLGRACTVPCYCILGIRPLTEAEVKELSNNIWVSEYILLSFVQFYSDIGIPLKYKGQPVIFKEAHDVDRV